MERHFQLLQNQTRVLTEGDSAIAANVAKAAVLSGALRKELGLSEAFSASNIPKWNASPMLRLAHVALAGVLCNKFGYKAAKLQFGTEALATATYGVIAEKVSAREIANYVVAGTFHGDLEPILTKNLGIFDHVRLFRESPGAIELRKYVADVLAANDGAEFVAALQGGLRGIVDARVLERARQEFGVMLPGKVPGGSLGGQMLWTDPRRGGDLLKRWRKRTRNLFQQALQEEKLRAGDPCPCGSGDRVRDCCGRP